MYKLFLVIFYILIISCNNPLTEERDMHCVVDYGGSIDDCGVCSGGNSNHIYNSDKDCEGNCWGTNLDCDDVDGCSDTIDECGICNGIGINQDLCGICYGDNTSCNTGLITLTSWQLDEVHYWNNSDCSGFPFYSSYDNRCTDEACDDYEISFSLNTEDGSLIFEKVERNWNPNTPNTITSLTTSGNWSFTNSQCYGLYLDYEDITLDDICYDNIEFSNTYFNCENNLYNCLHNNINLIKYPDGTDMCYKEKIGYYNPR